MPRDCTLPAAIEITLPGRRRGRLVAGETAGEFAVYCAATWIDQLAALGWLDRAERDAAATLHECFEAAGLRPHLTAAYDGVHVSGDAAADDAFEAMTPKKMRAWRRLHRLLRAVPAGQRSQVQAVACWDHPPYDLVGLRLGLRALAAALSAPRCRSQLPARGDMDSLA